MGYVGGGDVASDKKFGLLAFFHDIVVAPVVAFDCLDIKKTVDFIEPVFTVEFCLAADCVCPSEKYNLRLSSAVIELMATMR